MKANRKTLKVNYHISFKSFSTIAEKFLQFSAVLKGGKGDIKRQSVYDTSSSELMNESKSKSQLEIVGIDKNSPESK